MGYGQPEAAAARFLSNDGQAPRLCRLSVNPAAAEKTLALLLNMRNHLSLPLRRISIESPTRPRERK
jgi:hypothetical protein